MSYTEKAQPSFSAGVAVLSEYSAVAHSVKSIWPLLSPSRNLESRTEITSPPSLRPTWICGPRTWRSLTDLDRTWKSHFKVTTDQRVSLINLLLLKDLFFRKLVLEWIIEMTDVLSRFFRSFLYNFHVFRPENQRLDILTRTYSIEDTSLYRLEQTDLIPCWDWVETVGETEDTIPVCDKVWTGDGPASD